MNLRLLAELYGKEITLTRKIKNINGGMTSYEEVAILNKWINRKDGVFDREIDLSSIRILIDNSILVEDSGNFETGETHFVLNIEKLKHCVKNDIKIIGIDSLIPVLRELKLILFHITLPIVLNSK